MVKVFSKIGLSIVAVSVLLVASYAASNKAVSEESIGLRKVDIYSEDSVNPSMTKYSKSVPGSGYKIKRAFQDAPPMIPHDTEGMLPITVNDNQCISCHMPAAAKEMGMKATAIPKSHFTDFRPQPKLTGEGETEEFAKTADDMKNEVAIQHKDVLVNARFNCSACHAPQSEGQLVENDFKAKYTDKNGAKKSSWSGSKFTDGLDTLKD